VTVHFPPEIAKWLKEYSSKRMSTVSQIIRGLVVDLMDKQAPTQEPVERPVEIPTTKELRRIAALKRGGVN
jgi:hypothetical protein